MHDQGVLAAIAIALGLTAAVLLFVPFVWVEYRRRGTLSGRTLLTYLAVLVYFWAIWVFTLLPLPDPDILRCVGRNLDILQFVDDIRGALRRRGNALIDPAVLQLVFNMALFVPLGFFVRYLTRRGVVAALAVGLLTSVFIETTQSTGVWGLYPCAYRVFDVDDMLTNTTGAFIGSLLALPWHRRTVDPVAVRQPRPVSRGRRLVGMVCDLIAVTVISAVLSVATNVVLQYGLHDRQAVIDGEIARWVGSGGTCALLLLLVAVAGRTIGDYAVEIRFTGPHARPLRFITGIGGYLLVSLLPYGDLPSVLLAIVLVVWVWPGDHTGLPGAAGLHVQDARMGTEPARLP